MPAYSTEREKYHRERIRAVMVVRPKVTVDEIKKVLEESEEAPLTLGTHYIRKHQNKIIAERTVRLSLANQNQRIAFIQDKKERIDSMLWSEATNMNNSGRERIAALAILFKNEMEMLQAEMDAGVYERHIGTIRKETAPLSPEQKTRIIEAMIKWGIVKPKKHDQSKHLALAN